MSLGDVETIYGIIRDYELSRSIGVFYSGYSFIHNDQNVLCTFFMNLCHYIMVYKNSSKATKLLEINSINILFSPQEEEDILQFLINLQTLSQSSDLNSSVIENFKLRVNSNYLTFTNTIKKLAALSLVKHFYHEEANFLREVGYEVIYSKYFSNIGLKLSHAIYFLIELGVSVKIISSNSKTVEDIKPGCTDVLYFLNQDSNFYNLYTKEFYILITCSQTESRLLYKKVIEDIENNEVAGRNSTLELDSDKERLKVSIETLAKTFSVVYPNQDIYQIQDKVNTDLLLNEILSDFICFHCWCVATLKTKCGHAICNQSHHQATSPEFKCPRCKLRN